MTGPPMMTRGRSASFKFMRYFDLTALKGYLFVTFARKLGGYNSLNKDIRVETVQKKPNTFTDQMHVRLKGMLDPIGTFLNKQGISPKTMAMLGFLCKIFRAIFPARCE